MVFGSRLDVLTDEKPNPLLVVRLLDRRLVAERPPRAEPSRGEIPTDDPEEAEDGGNLVEELLRRRICTNDE